ncbi:MAG: ArnT family glycosyltransferase [Thermaurantimonas sp.]
MKNNLTIIRNSIFRSGTIQLNKYDAYTSENPLKETHIKIILDTIDSYHLNAYKTEDISEDTDDAYTSTINVEKPDFSSLPFQNQNPKKLFHSYFKDFSIIILIIAVLFVAASLILFLLNRPKIEYLTLLVLGTLSMRIFVITLNDYLYLWDEQFHALVAKNLIENPLKPTLYQNPILPYNYADWTKNHVWLHKQPFFLWQMALSMKVLGIHAYAARVPSALMSTLFVLILFRVGTLLSNEKIAYYSSLVFCFLNFNLIQTSGYFNTDHNDVALIFYVSASLWAFFEYQNSGKKKWIFLVGLFSGVAVLTKWLVGLLVYLLWAIYLLLERKLFSFTEKELIHMLKALSVTVLIAVPWQWYILVKYPLESSNEFSLNSAHFFSVIEDHSGDWTYHFSMTKELYGLPFILLFIFLLAFLKKIANRNLRYSLAISIAFVYIFFSIAATKMPAFTAVVSMFFLLAIGTGISGFFDVLVLNTSVISPIYYDFLSKVYRFVVLSLLCLFFLNIEKVQELHTDWKKDQNDFYVRRNHNINIYRQHSDILNQKNIVVINAPEYDEIQIMFEFNATAYGKITEELFRKLKSLPYKIVVLDDGTTPQYMLSDEKVSVIRGILPAPSGH